MATTPDTKIGRTTHSIGNTLDHVGNVLFSNHAQGARRILGAGAMAAGLALGVTAGGEYSDAQTEEAALPHQLVIYDRENAVMAESGAAAEAFSEGRNAISANVDAQFDQAKNYGIGAAAVEVVGIVLTGSTIPFRRSKQPEN